MSAPREDPTAGAADAAGAGCEPAGGQGDHRTADRQLDLRLVPLAIGAWLGAAVGVGLSPATSGWLCGLAALTAVGAALVSHRVAKVGSALASALIVVLLAATGVLVGGGSAGTQSLSRSSGVIGSLVTHRSTVTAVGVVTTPPRRARSPSFDGEPRYLVSMTVITVSGRGVQGSSRAPVLVIGGPDWSSVHVGAQVRTRGRLAPTEPGDPAFAVLRPIGVPQVVRGPPTGNRVTAAVRASFQHACSVLPADEAGLLPGIVVGDTAALPADLEQDMRTTGLTHLTAVSGANITIVCGAVLLALTAIGVRRLARLGLAGVAMLAFVAVAGPEPSVLRAAAMGAVGLLGLAVARPGAGVPPLCLAVIGLVLVDPWLGRAAGFAMSVLATAGLVVLARPIAEQLARLLPRWLALAIAVPVAAQVAVAPVSVLLTPALPVYTVPANMLVAPAIAPATVLGALAAGIAWIAMPVGHALVWVAGWPLRWVTWVAHFFAALPGASLPWPDGPRGATLVVVASVLALGAGYAVVQRISSSHQPRRQVLAVLSAGVVLLAAWGPVARDWWVRHGSSGWQVAACDVGQGTAVAVRSGQSSAVLLDVGPDPVAVDRCLTRLGVRTVDLIVLSHFHADHVDGLPGVLRGRPVGAVLVTGLAEPAAQARAVAEQLAGVGLVATVATRGVDGSAGDLRWEVLGPAQRPIATGNAGGEEGSGPNDASLVVRLDAADLSVLSLGDLETDGQRRLRSALAAGPSTAGGIDVVVVAHHGSAKQLPALYEAIRPRVAVISVGIDNDYGHPAPSALRMLEHLGVPVLRTDLCGTTVIARAADSDHLTTRCRWGGDAARAPPHRTE